MKKIFLLLVCLCVFSCSDDESCFEQENAIRKSYLEKIENAKYRYDADGNILEDPTRLKQILLEEMNIKISELDCN